MRFQIALAAADNNEKGDLFGRLMCDLFHVLGYEDFAVNIAKAGREIDIKGRHRTENKAVIAECKATSAPIGGSDVNKFAGAVQVESKKTEGEISAYFVSLSGFTASAVEQEREAEGRIILVDGERAVGELIKGRVIVGPAEAAVTAGKCRGIPQGAQLSGRSVLFAHRLGWIWAMFFKVNGTEKFYTLVHADGGPVSDAIAASLKLADGRAGAILKRLKYVTGVEGNSTEGITGEAEREYKEHVIREFGQVTLEGLPADQDTGVKRLRLENIYIPLHLRNSTNKENDQSAKDPGARSHERTERIPVSKAFSEARHIAILAPPGGGKTTLLKRLAIAYIEPARRLEIDDHLPDEPLLPVVIRCRQLGNEVRRPLLNTIERLLIQAERPDLGMEFGRVVTERLKKGEILLLIDGLDEIGDPGDRAAFGTQLRTFIGTYPAARVVVTSREAGFRTVAGTISSVCKLYALADLSSEDISHLCLSWHREVYGGREQDALDLAHSITSNYRVRELAVNPLLLTTLLLVKRWLGTLPSKRSVLYSKAIEVLLMTWNTEGHRPIDPEEAIPQLAYAAYSMLQLDKRAISAKELRNIIDSARSEMPEILSYARMSSADFIRRVEDRSSLLVQSGHIVEDGQIRPLYEFKHLTFQEYLAAVAAVESWHPDRESAESPLDALRPHIGQEAWREVVALTASLSGIRYAKEIVRCLVDFLDDGWTRFDQNTPREDSDGFDVALGTLHQCLIDEVPIPQDLVKVLVSTVIKYSDSDSLTDFGLDYKESRFASIIVDVVKEGIYESERCMNYASVLSNFVVYDLDRDRDPLPYIVQLIDSEDDFTKIKGILLGMNLCYTMFTAENWESDEENLEYLDFDVDRFPTPHEISTQLAPRLIEIVVQNSEMHFLLPAVWALCWCFPYTAAQEIGDMAPIVNRLATLFVNHDVLEVRNFAAWALREVPIVDRSLGRSLDIPESVKEYIRKSLTSDASDNESADFQACVQLAYYVGGPLSDDQMMDLYPLGVELGIASAWAARLRGALVGTSSTEGDVVVPPDL